MRLLKRCTYKTQRRHKSSEELIIAYIAGGCIRGHFKMFIFIYLQRLFEILSSRGVQPPFVLIRRNQQQSPCESSGLRLHFSGSVPGHLSSRTPNTPRTMGELGIVSNKNEKLKTTHFDNCDKELMN